MRLSLGTAVFSGMLGVTVFGIFLTPVFFYVIESLSETRLLATPAARWIVTGALGGSLGAAAGLASSKLVWGGPYLTPVLGCCLGMLVALLVQELHRRAAGSERPEKHGQKNGEPPAAAGGSASAGDSSPPGNEKGDPPP